MAGMNANELREFAGRIAAANASCEQDVVEESLGLFAHGAPSQEHSRWSQLVSAGSFNEAAMAIFRASFAQHGFQFGALPFGSQARAYAQVWASSDATARIYRAATPAMALICATAVEAAEREDAGRMARCPVCNGMGWYVTESNSKQMCRHPEPCSPTGGD